MHKRSVVYIRPGANYLKVIEYFSITSIFRVFLLILVLIKINHDILVLILVLIRFTPKYSLNYISTL